MTDPRLSSKHTISSEIIPVIISFKRVPFGDTRLAPVVKNRISYYEILSTRHLVVVRASERIAIAGLPSKALAKKPGQKKKKKSKERKKTELPSAETIAHESKLLQS